MVACERPVEGLPILRCWVADSEAADKAAAEKRWAGTVAAAEADAARAEARRIGDRDLRHAAARAEDHPGGTADNVVAAHEAVVCSSSVS